MNGSFYDGYNCSIPNSDKGLFFMAMGDVELSGYIPGAIGRIVELHGTYYSKRWGFDLFFESKVAIDLSEFLRRFNDTTDRFWVAREEEKIVGSIVIDGINYQSKGAHLRWFIVAPQNQGHGIGNMLIQEAVTFCRRKAFGRIYLWTFAGLEPARRLYEKFGFSLCEEHEGSQWGRSVTEQMFELMLK